MKLYNLKVVGVAGPGESLYNEATFEAFELINEEYPGLIKCISTNGLLLEEKVDELVAIGVRTVTVTVNATDPIIGSEIYESVKYNGERYKGEEASRILIKKRVRPGLP